MDTTSVNENDVGVGTADMAGSFTAGPKRKFKGLPCFDMSCADEYHSFSRGIKSFHRWAKHTKSENIRQWSRKNPTKSFYVSHSESYTLVNRSKK